MHDHLALPPKVSSASSRARRRARLAGVAQLVEHLFCKQVVGGSSPPASSTSFRVTSEGCPSGQREQAVNLPAHAYVGSNPTPSTCFLGHLLRIGAAHPVPHDRAGLRPRRAATHLNASFFAGVAQLVERQPSKLNVEGSNPFSRSSSWAGNKTGRSDVMDVSRQGLWVDRSGRQELRTAHLAQLVEHVLGKDEVTSSILVVGSGRSFETSKGLSNPKGVGN
jgi:hypothetical protein